MSEAELIEAIVDAYNNDFTIKTSVLVVGAFTAYIAAGNMTRYFVKRQDKLQTYKKLYNKGTLPEKPTFLNIEKLSKRYDLFRTYNERVPKN